jgi:Domain of unknown function (DUF1772)
MPGLIALVVAAIFFGAAIYINLAEHPARLNLTVNAALAHWGPSYKRGFMMQASLAVVSGVFGFVAWWTNGNPFWAIGAILMLLNWPFTMLVIMPLNHKLEATPLEGASQETKSLLIRWGHLHAVRSLLSGVSTIVFLIAAGKSL